MSRANTDPDMKEDERDDDHEPAAVAPRLGTTESISYSYSGGVRYEYVYVYEEGRIVKMYMR